MRASFFDGFPVVERARVIRITCILGSLCIEMYNVGIPVYILWDAPAAMCSLCTFSNDMLQSLFLGFLWPGWNGWSNQGKKPILSLPQAVHAK